MKPILLLISVFGISLAAFAQVLAPQEVQSVENQIIQLCIKNAKKTTMSAKKLSTVCSCSVSKTLEWARSENFEQKDPAPRVAWLKKMYEMKLTQAEVDADIHGLFEMNVPITEECRK